MPDPGPPRIRTLDPARPAVTTVRPPAGRPPAPRRGKPDATGAWAVLGLAGLASASALATAMLPSIMPQPVVTTAADSVPADAAAQPAPSVIHTTRVIQLAPGQTLPPDVAANMGPAGATALPRATPRPTPRVVIQTVTRQSGRP